MVEVAEAHTYIVNDVGPLPPAIAGDVGSPVHKVVEDAVEASLAQGLVCCEVPAQALEFHRLSHVLRPEHRVLVKVDDHVPLDEALKPFLFRLGEGDEIRRDPAEPLAEPELLVVEPRLKIPVGHVAVVNLLPAHDGSIVGY